MKATEQYFPVVLFIMPYKAVLTFESLDEIQKCDHSYENYWAVLSCGTVCYAVQGGSNFWVCGWNPKVWRFKWKLLSSTFLWCCLLRCTRCSGSNFWVCRWNPKVWTIQIKSTKQYPFIVVLVFQYFTKRNLGLFFYHFHTVRILRQIPIGWYTITKLESWPHSEWIRTNPKTALWQFFDLKK